MSCYRIIRTKAQYEDYSRKLMELSSRKDARKHIDDIELLDLLLADWERKNLRNVRVDPIQLLKSLMKNHGMSRNELAELLKINKSTISKILNYKKGLSKEVIRKLAKRFKLSQEAFNRAYKLQREATGKQRPVKAGKKKAA